MDLPLTPSGDSSRSAAKRATAKPVMPLRPPRERTRTPLAAGLLIARKPVADGAGAGVSEHPGAAALLGPAHVRASDLPRLVSPGGRARVYASLDVAPVAEQPPVDVVRYLLDVDADRLGEALALEAAGPVAVRVRGAESVRECAERVTAAHRSPVLPAEATADDAADFQAYVAHSDAGYLAEADDADGVVRALACAVAGISGFDVRAAFREPDVERLLSLPDIAADAVRGLLLGVLVPEPAAVADALAERGFGAHGDAEPVPAWYS